MLEAIDLTKRYEDGELALDGLTFKVEPGEIFCMFGANGAGKTTTINLFLGFLPPTSGTALVEGIDVAKDPLQAKRHVSFVSENVMLYGNFTAIQNLDYFSKLAGKRNLTKKDYAAVLDRVGLQKEAFDRRVKNFSKGMRQKLGIAIAVVKDAPNVLLDEPTSTPSRAGSSWRSSSRCATRASRSSCRPTTSSGPSSSPTASASCARAGWS
jgi:ABC-2 type transport system ATP-binding protein